MRLLRDRTVDVLAVLIARIDESAVFGGYLLVARDHQIDGRMPAGRGGVLVVGVDLHAPCGVDARPDLEYDVVDRDLVLVEPADLDDRQKSLAGLLVQPLEAVMGQNPVLPDQRDDVRRDADNHQIKQALHLRERQTLVLTVPLQHLEPHSAAGKFLERIPAIDPLGIEHGHRVGNGISGQMMIADDKVDSLGLGISHLFRRLDPAIERDDQLDPLALRIVYRLDRHAVPFGIAVGDVEQQRRVALPSQERIDERHRRRAVHVVISVDHDRLAAAYRLVDSAHGPVHILHQERVMQVLQFRIKELPCFLVCFDAALNK